MGGVLMTLGAAAPSRATTFNPDPIYSNTMSYTIQIPTTGSQTGIDNTDIYLPVTEDRTATFPIALMLQGAFVNKDDYSNFASLVARYGFTVVVPNHVRTVFSPTGPVTDLVADVELVNDVLDFLKQENLNGDSLVQGKVDTNQLGLLGHSLGGFVGLSAIQDICSFPFCTTSFTRPEELMAGIFYGTNFRDITGEFPIIDNEGIPTGLIFGDRDGVSLPSNTQKTYDQIQDPPKVLVNLLGANHYGITNEDSERDEIRPILPQEIATETIARWSALFLRAHVQGDADAFDYIYNTGDERDKNVVVSSARVSEPSVTWAMLLLGMGLAFTGLRNSKYSRGTMVFLSQEQTKSQKTKG